MKNKIFSQNIAHDVISVCNERDVNLNMFSAERILFVGLNALCKQLMTEFICANYNGIYSPCFDESKTENCHLIIFVYEHMQACDFSVLRRCRVKLPHIPALWIVKKISDDDKLHALELGAEDVLTYGIHIKEIFFRVGAILKRTFLNDINKNYMMLSRDDFYMEKNLRQCQFNHHDVQLSRIQFELMWILCMYYGKVIRRDILYYLLFDKSIQAYDRSLDMHISRTRKKLESAGMQSSRLVSIRGIGYQLKSK